MWDYNQLDLEGVVLPPVAVQPVTTLAKQGYSIHSLQLTSLTGAYVETAAHMVAGAPLLQDIGVEKLVRPAKILRLPSAEPYTLFRAADFEANDPGIDDGDALIIDTGWGRRWGAAEYLTKAPAFAEDTLEWLVEQPYSILATDTPVAECLWWDKVDPPLESEKGQAVLMDLYKRRPDNIILVAPLVNLHQIEGPAGTLIALPINTPVTPAAPCRAIFIEGVQLSG
jgi:kynurenine formamidase